MRRAVLFFLVLTVALIVTWPVLASQNDGDRGRPRGHPPDGRVTLPLRGFAVGAHGGRGPDSLTVRGIATALGPFEASGTVERNGGSNPFHVSGELSFACNTGELTGTYEGWYEIPERFEGLIPVGGTFVITGGTGRFEGAEGSGEGEGYVEFTESGPVLRVRLDGTVTMKVPQGRGRGRE